MTAQAIADEAPWPFAEPAPIGPDYDWRDDALCAQVDPEVFFPPKGGSPADAKRVCAKCDVREQCLQYALDNDEELGIWGGLTRAQRNRLKNGGQPVVRIGRGPIHTEPDAAIAKARLSASARDVAKQFQVDINTVYRVVAAARRRAQEQAEESTS